MKRNEILQHFPNGCTVECLRYKTKSIFYHHELSLRDNHIVNGSITTVWGFHDRNKGIFIVIEMNGQLAEIVTNDVVYAQLGKEVKAILDKETDYAIIGEKVSRLYER